MAHSCGEAITNQSPPVIFRSADRCRDGRSAFGDGRAHAEISASRSDQIPRISRRANSRRDAGSHRLARARTPERRSGTAHRVAHLTPLTPRSL